MHTCLLRATEGSCRSLELILDVPETVYPYNIRDGVEAQRLFA
jgi:hypothetical protein